MWQNIDDFLNRFISFGSDYWHLKTVLRSLISFKVVWVFGDRFEKYPLALVLNNISNFQRLKSSSLTFSISDIMDLHFEVRYFPVKRTNSTSTLVLSSHSALFFHYCDLPPAFVDKSTEVSSFSARHFVFAIRPSNWTFRTQASEIYRVIVIVSIYAFCLTPFVKFDFSTTCCNNSTWPCDRFFPIPTSF